MDYKPDCFELYVWIRAQRVRYGKGKLSADRIKRLEDIGFIWNPHKVLWNNGYEHAKAYVEAHGNIDVPRKYECEDGIKLKSWLLNQGTRYKTGRMSKEQQEKLERIGMTFKGKSL